MAKHGEIKLKHIEAILNMVGGEESINELVRQGSRLIVIRNHEFLKEVWDRYGKDLEILGAKRLYDPWEQPYRKVIRDIILPFNVKYTELSTLKLIEKSCSKDQFQFRVADDVKKILKEERGLVDEKKLNLSLFFTVKLFNYRKNFLKQHPFTPRPRQFWHNNLNFPKGTSGEIHTELLDLCGMLNFYNRYLSIWIKDAEQINPILPMISSSFFRCSLERAAGIVLLKNEKDNISVKFDEWYVEEGFDENKTPGVLVDDNYMNI